VTRAGLEVLDAGMHASVQDLGRPGLQRAGVAEGGALDPRALHEGAALLGHPPDRAALEMTVVGGRFRAFGGAVRLAVTGAPCPVRVDGVAVGWRTAFTLDEGSELAIGKVEGGVYAYLHLAGGIDVPPVLGSRSTHLRAGFGGLDGRAVRTGDVLYPATATDSREVAVFAGEKQPPLELVRVLWGVHAEEFDEAERARFLATAFRVSARRDRMGVRLEGAERPFTPARGLTLISDAVVSGDIQVPGDGTPIVLLADRQPTGGYPRLATVITADLPAFAQLPTGAAIRFALVEPDAAVAALAVQRRAWAAHAARVSHHPQVDPWRAINLVDGVFEGGFD